MVFSNEFFNSFVSFIYIYIFHSMKVRADEKKKEPTITLRIAAYELSNRIS